MLLLLAIVSCGACQSPASSPAIPSFRDVTEAAGIARATSTYDAAVGDFDGDGRFDLYVGNHASPAVLLRSLDAGRFEDVLAESGIDPAGDQHGTAWGDYDNDGRLDLYVSLGAGRGRARKRNRLYHNEGAAYFREVADAAGVTDPRGRSRAVAWLDVDNDGWLDLVIANFASPNRLFRNRGDGTFEDVSEESGIAELSATRLAWGDLDADGDPDLLLGGTPRGFRLLRNQAGARFVDATEEAGLGRVHGPVQGIALGDYDNDGIVDVYLAHGSSFSDVLSARPDGTIAFAFFSRNEPVGVDFETAEVTAGVTVSLFENGGPIAVEQVTCGRSYRPASSRFHCSAAAAVSDEMPPGELGFALWRDPSAAAGAGAAERGSWHLRWRGAGDHHLTGIIESASSPTAIGFRVKAFRGGQLWHGIGTGGFTKVQPDGLVHEANCGAAQWADVNNDSTLDLYVVDGGVDTAGGRNLLFLNDGHGRFVRAVGVASPPSGAGRPVGAHFFDLDGSGRQSLFLTNGWGAPPFDRGPYRLLKNESDVGNWLDVELIGTVSNRQGLGARIELTACGETQVRYHDGGSNYFSQSAVPPHFGLGRCARIDRLRVRWPSGGVDERVDVVANRVIRVVEREQQKSATLVAR